MKQSLKFLIAHWEFSLVASLVIVIPIVASALSVGRYAVTNQITTMSLGLSIFVLVSPLLACLLSVLPMSRKVVDRYLVATRTRARIEKTLLNDVSAVFVSVSVVFATSVLGLFIFSAYLEPIFDLAGDRIVSADGGSSEFLGFMTFSQLARFGTWVFVIVYAVWVGVTNALLAVLGYVLLLTRLPRIVAVMAPLLLVWADNIVLSGIGIPEFRMMASMFPSLMVQQPIWTALVPFGFLVILLVCWWFWLSGRRLDVERLQ